MNYSLQYYPDPGIAFDITKMLFVKLTPENIWKPMLTSFETSTQDFAYIQQRSEYFPAPKPELLLFSFYFRPKKMMFLTDVILKLFNKGFSSFSISQLLSYFDDVAQVKKDLFLFYFDDPIDDSGIEHSIRTSTIIPDKIKIFLFGFHIAPQHYIHQLKNTIASYHEIILNNMVLSQPESKIPSDFIEWLFHEREIPAPQCHNINFSLCYTTPYFCAEDMTAAPPFFITTIQTAVKDNVTSKTCSINELTQTLFALSDKRRIAIINLLITHHSMCIKDLASSLNLSETTVNHHIAELKKADLVIISHQKRKALYSFNSSKVYLASTFLANLSKEESLF